MTLAIAEDRLWGPRRRSTREGSAGPGGQWYRQSVHLAGSGGSCRISRVQPRARTGRRGEGARLQRLPLTRERGFRPGNDIGRCGQLDVDWDGARTRRGPGAAGRARAGQCSGVSSLTKQSGVELDIANSVWASADRPILGSFLDGSRRWYNAQVTSLVLHGAKAESRINTWVAQATKGKSPGSSATRCRTPPRWCSSTRSTSKGLGEASSTPRRVSRTRSRSRMGRPRVGSHVTAGLVPVHPRHRVTDRAAAVSGWPDRHVRDPAGFARAGARPDPAARYDALGRVDAGDGSRNSTCCCRSFSSSRAGRSGRP